MQNWKKVFCLRISLFMRTIGAYSRIQSARPTKCSSKGWSWVTYGIIVHHGIITGVGSGIWGPPMATVDIFIHYRRKSGWSWIAQANTPQIILDLPVERFCRILHPWMAPHHGIYILDSCLAWATTSFLVSFLRRIRKVFSHC